MKKHIENCKTQKSMYVKHGQKLSELKAQTLTCRKAR